MKTLRSIKILLALTFLLIAWGAVVRSTHSGLGCPDWPLCHGQWVPPFEKEVMIEYAHRLLASLVGFVTLGASIQIFKSKEYRSLLGKQAAFGLALLLVQIVLGGVTVKTELHAHVVSTHLGVGLIFLTLWWNIFLRLRVSPQTSSMVIPTSCSKNWCRLALVVLFLQIVLGGLVAASNAGLACPDFPMCQGVWWPSLKEGVGLHFMHRLGALLTTLLIMITLFSSRKLPTTGWVLGAVLFQISLGIGNVMMGLPVGMRVAHLGVAAILFLALWTHLYFLRRPYALHS